MSLRAYCLYAWSYGWYTCWEEESKQSFLPQWLNKMRHRRENRLQPISEFSSRTEAICFLLLFVFNHRSSALPFTLLCAKQDNLVFTEISVPDTRLRVKVPQVWTGTKFQEKVESACFVFVVVHSFLKFYAWVADWFLISEWINKSQYLFQVKSWYQRGFLVSLKCKDYPVIDQKSSYTSTTTHIV